MMLTKMGWVNFALVTVCAITGCADEHSATTEAAEIGTVALPLTTYGPSGVRYQLRNATFEIIPQSYYYGVGGAWSTSTTAAAGTHVIGTGGFGASSSTAPSAIVVSSDSDPEAPSIDVELEEGSYQIYLRPGWYLDRIEDGVSNTIEAQLLSGEWQWAYVSPRLTNWVTYQFGVGPRSIWFNGELNIDMQVFEDPDDYYGPSYGGFGGMGGFAGLPTPVAGTAARPGAPPFGRGGTSGI